MADDLDKKLKQIADMFGVSDTQSLKNIVENIAPEAGSNKGNPSPEHTGSSHANTGYSSAPYPNYGNSGLDMNILSKANEMFSMLNNVRDSRINLLTSVHPFLGPQRQQRLSGAIQLLKVVSILSTIAPTINRNNKG